MPLKTRKSFALSGLRASRGLSVLAAVLALVCLGPLALPAQDEEPQSPAPVPTRIGFVDVELVLEKSAAIQEVMAEIDSQMADQGRIITLKERDLAQKQLDLQRQTTVLSESERAAREEEIETLADELSRLQFEFEREARSRERRVGPLVEKIMEIIADTAEEEGYAMVLRGEVVIYGHNSVNLTDSVVEKVDSQPEAIESVFGLAQEAGDTQEQGEREYEEQVDGVPAGGNDDLLPLIP